MERYRVLATHQHGAIARAQLSESGLTAAAIRWRTRNGDLEEVLPGVYRMAGSPRTWEQRLMATVLWGGSGTVASHKSAAALWGFNGFGPGPLEISTLKQNRAGLGFKGHRSLVAPALTTTKVGIPVTNAFRTLRDVVLVVSDTRANQLFDELLRKGFVSMASVREMVNREAGSGNRGVGVLRNLVNQRDPDYKPSASEFQALVRRLLTGAGFAFVEEYEVFDSEGNFVGRADFKLLDVPVLVEAEGRANHSSKSDFERDLVRRNGFTMAGLATVHVTWDMATDHAEEFLDEVRRVRGVHWRS